MTMTTSEAFGTPTSLPNYTLGDEAHPTHLNALASREEAATDAKSLNVGDAAFVLRSDRKWAYGIVTEREEGEGEECILRFLVDKKNNRKSFPEDVWGKYIRVIKVDAIELARLEAEDGVSIATESVAPGKEEERQREDTKVDAIELARLETVDGAPIVMESVAPTKEEVKKEETKVSAIPEQAPESNNASPSSPPPQAPISLPNYILGDLARLETKDGAPIVMESVAPTKEEVKKEETKVSAIPEQAPESNNASPSSSPPRAPISLPNYILGDEARTTHYNASSTREEAAIDAKSLTAGDAAFILRRDYKWAYAIVVEKEEGENSRLVFMADKKNRKTFPESAWGKYIRVIKVDADELAKLEAESVPLTKIEETKEETTKDGDEEGNIGSKKKKALTKIEEDKEETTKDSDEEGNKGSKKKKALTKIEEAKEETTKDGDEEGSKGFKKKKEKKKKENKSGKEKSEKRTLMLGEFSSDVGSWFSSKFGGSKKTKENMTLVVKVEKEDTSPATPSEDKGASPEPETETEDTEIEMEIDLKDLDELKITKSKSRTSSFLNALPAGIFSKKSKSFDVTKTAASKTKGASEPDAAAAAEDGEKREDAVADAKLETPASTSEAEKPSEDLSSVDETTRDVVEKKKSTPDDPISATTEEETSAHSASVEVTATADPSVVKVTSPEPEIIPIPVPIKLLQTPIQFYKAATMTEDPAAAALAATSFADFDDSGIYGLGEQGVMVVESDPFAAASAGRLGHDRVEALRKQGLISVEDIEDEALREQGITIVETC